VVSFSNFRMAVLGNINHRLLLAQSVHTAKVPIAVTQEPSGIPTTVRFVQNNESFHERLSQTSSFTHTMRRTKATLIYRRTKNLRAVQLLLGHTSLESTVRYLGIEVDDALEIAEQTEI